MTIKGYNSTDSDECLGLLAARNIYHMNQAEASRSINHAFARQVTDPQEMSDRLGVALWVLRQGLAVDPISLNQAYLYARRLRDNREYLDAFMPPAQRFHSIAAEIEFLQQKLFTTGLYN